ncbi:hypothetical protein AVEN_208822-1 [Araneus ventricosus]|uniref:Uncharacterized protein n=1 Tax=Araneus ventricosus TaxID=182803 RepID=A0A4Y2TYF3_ARAVE|nr:hypothetical protein AVEN_208822-1 [Araneus ventricosus]
MTELNLLPLPSFRCCLDFGQNSLHTSACGAVLPFVLPSFKIQSTLVKTSTQYEDHSIITTSDKTPNCVSLCAMLFYFRYNDCTVSSNPNTTFVFNEYSSRCFSKENLFLNVNDLDYCIAKLRRCRVFSVTVQL